MTWAEMKLGAHTSTLKAVCAVFCAVLVAALAGCASKMPPPPEPIVYDPAHDAAERERLKAERSAAERHFRERERDCYQRFAVNSCLKRTRRERRVVIENIKRQEIMLNDARRAYEAERQRQRVQQREAEREQRLQDAQGGSRP